MMLVRKADEIYICILCVTLVKQQRNLFVCKIPIQESGQGPPSFIGHTKVEVPALKDTFGREITVDKYGLQFTPDAQGLVLLDDVKTPYCRGLRCDCQCSTCVSYCYEENAVKIVQPHYGYVSVTLKLKTIHCVHCILVCEPDYLVALDESGRFYVWVMDPNWSGSIEDYVIPSYDVVASRVMEMRKIPKCGTLVVGHNGCGDFTLWDLARRTVLSRFSASIDQILEFVPLTLFNCQTRGLTDDKLGMEEHINQLVEATSRQLSQGGQKRQFSSSDGKDIATWVLICAASDMERQHGYLSSNSEMNVARRWRLGLLVKNTLILGDVLDPRTSAIGSSAGRGIIGTQDGLVYSWDLASGTILQTLHKFKGGISHIATDESSPDVIAVADGNGQLAVYLLH